MEDTKTKTRKPWSGKILRENQIQSSEKIKEKKDFQKEQNAKYTKFLLPEESGALIAEGAERTTDFTQRDIKQLVDIQTARKIFDLVLDHGPYKFEFSRDGTSLILAGRDGHVALIKWQTKALVTEFKTDEKIRGLKCTFDDGYFVTANEKYTKVYDSAGAELHTLRPFDKAKFLEYLPYHFLLVGYANDNLIYYDISTRTEVAKVPTRSQGTVTAMRQNPWNAIILTGHFNGRVCMWSPSCKREPLVSLQCGKAAVTALAVDSLGRFMYVAIRDRVTMWNIKTYKKIRDYKADHIVTCIDISQKGMLAVGCRKMVMIWKKTFQQRSAPPYLRHSAGSIVEDLHFCPFEDILGVGTEKGYSSIIVPGSGEPNIDTLEINPYASDRQKNTASVKLLLDKPQPEMISLNPDFVGDVSSSVIPVAWKKAHPGQPFPGVQALQNEKKFSYISSNKAGTWEHKREQITNENFRKKLAKLDEEQEAKKNSKEEVEQEEFQPEEDNSTPQKKRKTPPSALSRFSKKKKVQ